MRCEMQAIVASQLTMRVVRACARASEISHLQQIIWDYIVKMEFHSFACRTI